MPISTSQSQTSESVAAACVERTPGDGMDNRTNKDLFHSLTTINNTNNTSSITQLPSSVAPTSNLQQLPNGSVISAPVETNESYSVTSQQPPLSSVVQQPTTVEQQRPRFEASDFSPAASSGTSVITPVSNSQDNLSPLSLLNKQVNQEVAKSLPSDLNSPAPGNHQKNSFQNQQQHFNSHQFLQKSSSTTPDLDLSLVQNSNIKTSTTTVSAQPGLENMQNNSTTALWQQHLQQNQNRAPTITGDRASNALSPTGSTASDLKNFDGNQQHHQQQQLSPGSTPFELHQQHQQQQKSQNEKNVLYEPFNSRTSWPIGGFGSSGGVGGGVNNSHGQPPLSGSRFKSMWSEATYMENEKRVCF